MKVTETALNDLLVVESPVSNDDRGFFTEVYHSEKFALLGLSEQFVQDNHSRSVRNVLRGLHYQIERPQGKLVRPVTGTIFDVAVDLRESSSTFGKWFGMSLTAGDGKQLWIPAGFAHGFLVLSAVADVLYKCTSLYHGASDRSLAWNDESIAIEWPIPSGQLPLLSAKDSAAPTLAHAQRFR
ncbi:MAG: dTDP-4-dehydrorhamnose 3,5-epimerase [Gemmatimonadaceae bacterium]